MSDDAPGTLRERKKERTRRAIHNAAFALAADRGLGQVTIADICAAAGISERTFFNYFPSKAAATLGVPERPLSPEQEQRFLEGAGSLVDDLCELVAGIAGGPEGDIPRIKRLMGFEPDLLAALHQWSSGARRGVIRLAEKRATPERARLAVGLVFAALMLHADTTFSSGPGRATPEELRGIVARLCAVGDSDAA
ncbi:TetR family transcriptional regulator [Sinomonas sp. ASV486]|uniref:TetR family transcriptional regulator n=1 Tax=Sinomonas puerhi TaxID=3238584 RepID=A0AB39L3B9_9MICC|nr:TetR family transcriptional regulator [Sinomonas sp. ASV486]MDQ4489455.1 TetR family transcriptional regulator [Sinomonas sp. ASV486]